MLKRVRFLGSSKTDLRGFPAEVRGLLGIELLKVQLGKMPSDFKPMPTIGAGVYEIRVSVGGAWRLLYVAKFSDAVYVLHVFQKKTQKTAAEDLEVAKKRYRTLGD